jgi:hypothetical protein
LKLAEADARRGSLDRERMLRIRDTVAEIIDDLSTYEDKLPAIAPKNLGEPSLGVSSGGQEPRELAELWRTGKPVLCIPGLGLIDEAATLILAELIAKHEIGVRVEQADALSISRIFGLDTHGVAAICLCYVETVTPAQIRYAVRRLRRKAPDAFMLVTLLGDRNVAIGRDQLAIDNGELVKTLGEATNRIKALAAGTELEPLPRAATSELKIA